jgi:hypothetical protein
VRVTVPTQILMQLPTVVISYDLAAGSLPYSSGQFSSAHALSSIRFVIRIAPMGFWRASMTSRGRGVGVCGLCARDFTAFRSTRGFHFHRGPSPCDVSISTVYDSEYAKTADKSNVALWHEALGISKNTFGSSYVRFSPTA